MQSLSSVIIPTFGRKSATLVETLNSLFQLGAEFQQNIGEVFLIDQNPIPLQLPTSQFPLPTTTFCPHLGTPPELDPDQLSSPRLFHLVGLTPSVTRAKNIALKLARGEIIFFFDDDVTIRPGNLKQQILLHRENPQMGLLMGREIIDPPHLGRPAWKERVARMAEFLTNNLDHSSDQQGHWKVGTQYVGKITPKGIFFCNFSLQSPNLIRINTVRGCNASVKRHIALEVKGFDEQYQGSALREESDFCLRIEKAGYIHYYSSSAVAIHRRQLGGCNNLSQKLTSYLSKLECEKYFQECHFPKVSRLWFFIRLIPLCLEHLKATRLLSLFLLIQTTLSLNKETKNGASSKEMSSQ